MNVIKKAPLDIMQYAHELKAWIIENQYEYFKNYRAVAWQDFDHWKDSEVTRNKLVMPDEHLLIDRDFEGAHTLVICKISKSKENQRVNQLYPVVKISKLLEWRNGYFLLPDLSDNK